MTIEPQGPSPLQTAPHLNQNLPALAHELEKSLSHTRQMMDQAIHNPDQINEPFCQSFANSIMELNALCNQAQGASIQKSELAQTLAETSSITQTILEAQIYV